MSKPNHQCSLPAKGTSGLPRLAPNANWLSVLHRSIRKSLLVSSRHYKTKKLFRNRSAVIAERKKHATGPYFFVIHPLSCFNIVLEALFVITWFQNIITVPLREFMDDSIRVPFKKLHGDVVGPLQVIIILLFFNVGFVRKKTKDTVLEPRKIFRKYITTYFIFDFSATPYMAPILMAHVRVNDKELFDKLSRFAYLLSVFGHAVRIPTLIHVLNDVLANMTIGKRVRSVACHFVKTIQILHIQAFVVYVISRIIYTEEKMPKESWLYKSKLFPHSESVDFYKRYYESLFTTACFFFGIEYIYQMDIYPEQIVTTCICFFGRLYTLYLLADVLRVFGMAGVSESAYERRLAMVRQYTEDQDMPQQLRQRIMQYMEYKHQGHYFKENAIMEELSANLKTDLFLYSARKMIEKVSLFRRLPYSTVAAMIALMRSETFAPRDVIIKAGDSLKELFFISTGTVVVLKRHGAELCHLEDGAVFGTSCILFNLQQYTVMAIEITEVFIMHVEQFFEFLRPFPEVREEFHRSIMQRMENLSDMEQRVTVDKLNLMSELERGNLLEAPTKRIVVD